MKEIISKELKSEILKIGILEEVFSPTKKYLSKQDFDKFCEFDFSFLSEEYPLSEQFIEKFQDKVNWEYISQKQNLSEEFIEKFGNKICWRSIVMFQKLSENFLLRNKKNINWNLVATFQKLSNSFIENNSSLLNLMIILKFQKLSLDLKCKILNNGQEMIKIISNKRNWLYVTKEEKLDYIKQNTNYQIIDDKIIAYKSVRSDYYSCFNFQYKYEVGNTYEAHCDCNIYMFASFGLSAWTKEEALRYYSKGKLLKVEIDINDIGAIVFHEKKIRCFKFKVIEEIKF